MDYKSSGNGRYGRTDPVKALMMEIRDELGVTISFEYHPGGEIDQPAFSVYADGVLIAHTNHPFQTMIEYAKSKGMQVDHFL